MRTLEMGNLPDELYEQIERLARVKGRSVGELVAAMLARAVALDADAEAGLMAEIRAEREAMAKRGVLITDEDIRAAKNWGREMIGFRSALKSNWFVLSTSVRCN